MGICFSLTLRNPKIINSQKFTEFLLVTHNKLCNFIIRNNSGNIYLQTHEKQEIIISIDILSSTCNYYASLKEMIEIKNNMIYVNIKHTCKNKQKCRTEIYITMPNYSSIDVRTLRGDVITTHESIFSNAIIEAYK